MDKNLRQSIRHFDGLVWLIDWLCHLTPKKYHLLILFIFDNFWEWFSMEGIWIVTFERFDTFTLNYEIIETWSDPNHINAKSKFAASPNFDAHHSIHFWTVKLHWLILALVVLIKSDQKSMKIHKSYFGILNIPNLGFTWHNFSVCKLLLFCQIIQIISTQRAEMSNALRPSFIINARNAIIGFSELYVDIFTILLQPINDFWNLNYWIKLAN